MKDEGFIEDKCVWHKSSSITKANKRWYLCCHDLCDGFQEQCEQYSPRVPYFKDVVAELRQNQEYDKGW